MTFGSKSGGSKVRRLECLPNNYPWGPKGLDSMVARLAPNACPEGFKVEPNKHYSELWMGTHPTNPSRLHARGDLLSTFLAGNPALLGAAGERFKNPIPPQEGEEGKHVPFLFKVLCCYKALPLQIHPDKQLAEKLHEKHPDKFPDNNHKPEIAVCLSDRFLGFGGFRPTSLIKQLLLSTPEIELLPKDVKSAVVAFAAAAPPAASGTIVDNRADELAYRTSPDNIYLRSAWRAFLAMKGDEAKAATHAFCQRVKKEGTGAFSRLGAELPEREKQSLVDAIEVLERYNPFDPAILGSILFMNLYDLKKGEAIYVGADAPHAWLSGDIVELMAISDNVLNVGFQDDKDSISFVSRAMTVNPKPAADNILRARPFHKGKLGRTTVYATPFEEFSILRIQGTESLAALDGPGIATVTTKEEVTIWDRDEREAGGLGAVWFVGAGTELGVKGEGEVWMAFYDGDKSSGEEVGKQ